MKNIAQKSNEPASPTLACASQRPCLSDRQKEMHVHQTHFVMDRFDTSVVVKQVAANCATSTLILHAEASFTSAQRGLRRGISSRTSLKHHIWFGSFLSLQFSFTNNSKGLQLLAQCRLALTLTCSVMFRLFQQLDISIFSL